MKSKGIAALALATVVAMVAGGSALFAQQQEQSNQKDQPNFGRVEPREVTAVPTAAAEKKFGYATERGAFSVQNKAASKGMVCFRQPPQEDRFYDNVQLKYLRYGTTNTGFHGPYYETKVGNTALRVLFSYNTDVYGRYYVFYANTSDTITSTFHALSRCESHN